MSSDDFFFIMILFSANEKTIFFNDIDFNVDNHIEILNHNLIKKEYFFHLKHLCQLSYI